MKTRSRFLPLLTVILAALLPASLFAQPLVIVEPVGKSAFVGDANVTFEVVAKGTPAPTLQWQIKVGTGTFTNLSDSATYTGTATANLTIHNPDVTLNTNKYRCVATSNSVSVNSMGAQLMVFPTPSVVPVLTVTPSSIAANSTANITISITGLSTGDLVRVRRFLDTNGNNQTDPGEPLVQSFVVVDGQVTSFGGVTDPEIPGDTDQSANGNITTHISLPLSPEIGRTSGNYVIKVSSPTGEFRPITKILTVTQPTYAQTVSGQITSSGSPVPFAGAILLLPGPGNNQIYIASVVANVTGNYSMKAPVGTYMVLPYAVGFSAPFSGAASVTLTTGQTASGKNLIMNAATATVSGQVFDPNLAGSAIQGVQLFVRSQNNGEVAIANSDSDGGFNVPVTNASDWDFQVSSFSTNLIGYLVPSTDPMADTSGGSVNLGLPLTQANALIYGTFKDNLGTPLRNVDVNANDGNFNEDAITDLSGNYFLLAIGPASGLPDTWNVSTSSDNNSGLNGYLPPPDQTAPVLANNAYPVNFVTNLVTAHFTGNVTNNGAPVAGAVIDAVEQLDGGGSNPFIQATSDNSGHFDLGVVGGNWTLTLDNDSAQSLNLVGPSLSGPIADNQTISGIAFAVKSGTATIHGTVINATNQAVAFANVFASATIGGVVYNAGSMTDSGGHYSFPVINGEWDVGVGQPGYTDQIVDVNGASQTVIFGQSVDAVITSEPQDASVFAGQSTNFNIGLNTPGNSTEQWQFSVDDGATWSNVTNGGVNQYQGATSASLNLGNATVDLDGILYQCLVFYTLNNTPVVATSDAALLTVGTIPAIPQVTQDPSNASVVIGAEASFTANAIGNPSPIFHWQLSSDSGATWSNLTDNATISGSQSGFLSVNNTIQAMSGQQYRLFVFNSNGNAASKSAVLTVAQPTFAPNITTQPQNSTITLGSNTTFVAVVTGTPILTYQWQIFNVSNSTWSNLTDNATIGGAQNGNGTLRFTAPPASYSGGQYRLFVYNASGNATSNLVVLTVNLPPLAITHQPENAYALVGKSASFSVTANSTNTLSYQWRFNGANITHATGSTFTIPKVAAGNIGIYSVRIVDSFNTVLISDNATLALGVIPKISTQPAALTVTAGHDAVFSVNATGTPAPSYQWQGSQDGKTWKNLGEGDGVTGYTTSHLTVVEPDISLSGVQARVVVTNAVGNVTSKAAKLTVVASPQFTGFSTSPIAANGTITLAAGTAVTFSVNATGTALKYQWMLNGKKITGATKAVYTIGKTVAANSGTVTVVVTGSVAPVITSDPIILNVLTKPTIITQPKALTVKTGASASFFVVATGNPVLSYQWQFNGANITGATSANLTLIGVASGNQGAYLVKVINSQGTTPSSSVKLTVKN